MVTPTTASTLLFCSNNFGCFILANIFIILSVRYSFFTAHTAWEWKKKTNKWKFSIQLCHLILIKYSANLWWCRRRWWLHVNWHTVCASPYYLCMAHDETRNSNLIHVISASSTSIFKPKNFGKLCRALTFNRLDFGVHRLHFCSTALDRCRNTFDTYIHTVYTGTMIEFK